MANTPNLGLHQWQPGDSFLREDFNGDFGKIDAALGAAPASAHVAGTYQGNSQTNVWQSIELGFSPSAVIICQMGSGFQETGAILVRGTPLSAYDQKMGEITDCGFAVCMVHYNGTLLSPQMNLGGRVYTYIAFR